jgi:hypothetical protein
MVMDKDDIRIKVITDKFNKLKLIRIDFHKVVFLDESTGKYGIYIDNQMETLSINPYYFMFDYIGIDEDRWDFVDYYGDYIIDLIKEKTFFTFDVNHSYIFISFDKKYINSIQDFIDKLMTEKGIS